MATFKSSAHNNSGYGNSSVESAAKVDNKTHYNYWLVAEIDDYDGSATVGFCQTDKAGSADTGKSTLKTYVRIFTPDEVVAVTQKVFRIEENTVLSKFEVPNLAKQVAASRDTVLRYLYEISGKDNPVLESRDHVRHSKDWVKTLLEIELAGEMLKQGFAYDRAYGGGLFSSVGDIAKILHLSP